MPLAVSILAGALCLGPAAAPAAAEEFRLQAGDARIVDLAGPAAHL
jgi:hypothetical protein